MRYLCFFAACLLIAADDPRPKTLEEADFDRLQGAWTRVSTETSGQKRLLKDPRPLLVVAGNDFKFGPNLDPEVAILDAKPILKSIDLIPTGETAGPLKGKSYPGIYKIDGDSLTLCLSIKPGSARPTCFATAGNAWIIDVYERAKPVAAQPSK